MRTGLTIALRRLRRAVAFAAVCLLVLQALIAAVSSARAAAILAADPITGVVICHGAGTDPAGGVPPDHGDDGLCCAWCTTAAPVAALPDPPPVAPATATAVPAQNPIAGSDEPLPSRAVRAGPSQAPPAQL